MKRSLSLFAAIAAVAAAGAASPAFATSYTFLPEAMTPAVTASAAATDFSSTTDTFAFTVDTSYTTALGDLAFEGTPSAKDVITSVDLSLYSGTPTGAHTLLGTTGVVTDPTPGTGYVFATSLTETLSSGSYYLEVASTVPTGDLGQYVVSATVSSAPEPSTWALMIAGVAVVGAALRFRRRAGLVAA